MCASIRFCAGVRPKKCFLLSVWHRELEGPGPRYFIRKTCILAWNLLVCNSCQYIYVTGLFNFSFAPQDLIDRIDFYFQRILFSMKTRSLLGISLRRVVRKNYSGKSSGGIRCHNLYSFKEGVILLFQSTYETRLISHLHNPALFTVPLKHSFWYESVGSISVIWGWF